MIKRQSDSSGQPMRVQRVRSMVIDRDEDLALFQDMRNRELNNYLHPSKDDIEASLTTKFGGISGYRVMVPLTPRKGANDLLTTEAEKNDYDWLLTPPGTPLFPSLDQEKPSIRPSHRDPSARSAHLTRSSRLSNPQDYSSSTVPRSISSPRQTGSAANVLWNGSLRVQSTSAPTVVSLSPSSRASTPTRRSASPNHGKANPSYVRSKTPTARPSTPPFRASNLPVRSSTPTSRSNTPTSRPLTPTMRRSLSSPVSSSVNSSIRSSSSTRGNSPSRKSMTSSLVALGLSLEPPPNLRTTVSERSTSTSRGASFSARARGSSLLVQAQNIDALDLSLCEQRPSSPNLSISSSSASQETEVFSSHSSRDSIISPYRREVSGTAWMVQMTPKPGIHPKKSRITQMDPSTCKVTPLMRKSAKAFLGKSSSSRGNSRKSTEVVSWQKDTRQSTSRGFRPLMASSYAASFYTKASNLVDHPPCSIFGSSVNNGSNGSSEYGATVAPESECGDPDGEAISKKYHNGSLEGKSKFSVDQEAESLSCEEVHYEDGQVVGSQLEAKDDEDVLPPEDANLCEIDSTQNTANLSFKFGLEGDGAFENKIQDTDLVSHEDKCDKKTDCTSMCSSLFNLQTSDLKMKSSAASNEKDPLEDVDQNYDHQTDENIKVLEHDAMGLSLVVGTAGIQRKCTGILNPEDSKALDAIPYHIAEFAAELELTIHQGVPNYFENQSSECQFEDKMDIDYYVPRQIKSKLRVESEEDCLEEQGVAHVSLHIPDEILSSHAHCKTELLDPNCSNSSMEVYQFNERLELSRVETEVSSAYKQSSCLSHSTKLAYYRLEDCNSRDHQSGEQSEMVQPATRVQSINLETVTAEKLRGTVYDLEKAGMNDKLGPTQADRPLFSDKAQRGSRQESCSDSVSVESMIWQVKDNDDAPSNKNCCSFHLGLLGSQDSMNHTSVSRGDPTNGVLSRLSVETENSEHCKCLLNIRAERVPIEEENITAPAGYVEMLLYDSSSYAGTEDKECVDYHADALAQEKFCMNEPEKAFRCPPDSLIANKSAATVLMDERKGILSPTSGARKTDFMSGEKIVAIVHKDGTDSQAHAVTGSEILQALDYRLRSFSSDSSGYTADSHVDNNCGFSLVRCKQDYLVEEEQSCSDVIVNQMEYLKACAEDISSLRCASDNLSSSSNSHEPVHEEDITMSEAVQPHKLNTAKEILQSSGEDFVVEKRIPACLGSTAKATETDTICSSIVHDLVSRAVALAAEKDELATFATPASMKELVTLLGASETKGKIHRELENREPGNLNGPNIGAGSTVRRTLTYMQNQKVMQSPTVAYLQSPVGKVKENMRDEDDSMLVAFEIDERDDAAIKTKHKCCCTIM